MPMSDPKYRSRANIYALYSSENDLGIPDIQPETWIPPRLAAWQDLRSYGSDAAMHFFLDDYRFEPLWHNPEKYLERLGECGAILSPDFSVFSDWPLAVQIWQTYRNRWVGAHLQALGFRVIPTVGWTVPADLFFDGVPKHSVLATATTGVRRTAEGIDYFMVGFQKLAALEPIAVLVYGGLDGLDLDRDAISFPVYEYPAFLDLNRQRMEDLQTNKED